MAWVETYNDTALSRRPELRIGLGQSIDPAQHPSSTVGNAQTEFACLASHEAFQAPAT